ncbi:ABC transporter ATP-binding protein [Solwaraspora sp. WMMA2056]|nr:ABC transporter ATP-binding protein [Solwaraspora sp. WMMA2056]WJK42349.1 ABC transporter ATP-binding protein [Solwaraspora sp. WMMA2056]
MRPLPEPDPGVPDARSPGRYLLWLVGRVGPALTAAALLSVVWTVSQALMPAVVGVAIDSGLTDRDAAALRNWGLVLLGLGLLQATAGVVLHRFAVFVWLSTAYRTTQITVRQANRLGAALPKRLATGEVVSIGTADISNLGSAIEIVSRASGALVAIVVITAILLATSVPLGLVVLVGVPLLMAVVGGLVRPLHRHQQVYRDQQATLATLANDIVTGLRIVRGVGGERVLTSRYRTESQELRRRGVRVAGVESLLEATQLLLPGMFLVLVTWLGARFTLSGEITVGQLVAFYGYTAFLVGPIRTLSEFITTETTGYVAARRVVGLLALAPELTDPPEPKSVPRLPGVLFDAVTGLRVAPGRLTTVAATDPAAATALADRLGRYVDAEVTLAGVPLRELALGAVRERILVADNDARLFTGRLRDELDIVGGAADDELTSALVAASATDIVAALPDGLDARVAERGREFSGGQQQRLRLVRALLTDPPILVLVEPTSAVDAHTEARIAGRLRAARSGRTTVVCSTSPLLLDQADQVAFLHDGKVVAEGTHRALLEREPRYAALVTRGGDQP